MVKHSEQALNFYYMQPTVLYLGAFGNVFKGKLHLKSEDKEELVQVAVKTIKSKFYF